MKCAIVSARRRGGEWLVTDRPGMGDGYEKIVTIGKYQVFRAKGKGGP